MKKVFFILLLLVPAFFSQKAHAGNEKFNARISGTSVLQYAKVTVKDSKYDFMDAHKTGSDNWKTSFANKKITNTITLSVDPYSLSMQTDPYEITAEVQVQYQKWDDATSKFIMYTLPSNQFLNITYAATGTANYKDKSVYTFEGGNLLTIKIVNITRKVNGVTSTRVDFPVYLEGEVSVDRYYAFNAAAAPILQHADQTSGSGEVEVTWNFLEGAEEYDLEWTYVNNFDDAGTPLPQSLVVFEADIFRFNSSRISTTNNFYKIPVIYEQGYLLFRVRGVGRSANGTDNYTKNIYSKWSVASETYTTVAQFPDEAKFQIVSGHQKNLNWQYNISYAEEGKSKVVVSYFDGSLRNRQAVTRMNTKSDQVIVGETLYDHQGRPAIQVLPVPFSSSVIEYKPDFNKNGDNKPYSKVDFDYDATCEVQAAPLNKVSGASNYYSEQNSIVGASPYIPNANGYPFTQTQFTPDNTGRIKAQSGVGDTHKLGSDHETQYFYGKPTSQVELDRLFGSEVGDVIHYKKNMVVDPNGQVSVSYLDPQGRVVATALAGATPTNLVDLGATQVDMKADFLNKVNPLNPAEASNAQTPSENSLTYTQELLVTTADTRDFNYLVVPEKFQDACTVAGVVEGSTITKNICYNCVLDLQIRLTDECGTDFLVNLDNTVAGSTTTTIGKALIEQINLGNYTIDNFDPSTCTTPETFKIGTASAGSPYTSAALHRGNYTISKVLTVNEQALDFYLENYLKKNECLLTLTDFITDEMSHLDTLTCNMTCDQCLDNLGTYDKYNPDINPDCNPCMTPSEYASALSKCNNLCNTTAMDCRSTYQMMLGDVSPMGQYGLFLDAEGQPHPESFYLSMFNTNNSHTPKSRNFGGHYHPNWKNPMYKDKDGVLRKGYLGEDGKPVLLPIYPQVTGGYSPQIDDDAVIVTIGEDQYVAPEDLKNVMDAIFAWKKSWSASLVMHHPEYMMYEYCILEEQSHLFDEGWLQKNTLSAVPTTYWEPLGVDMDHAVDPYFNDAKNPLLLQRDYDYMKYSMNNYATLLGHNITMLQMAYATNHCPNQGASNCNASTLCDGVDLSLITPTTARTTYFTDDDWIQFRMLYYSLKQRLYNKASTKFAINNTSYNGCIGSKGYFRWYDNDFFASPYERVEVDHGIFGKSIYYRYGRSQYFNPEQACSYLTYPLYRNKVKRFDDPEDNPPNTGANASVCYNEISDGEYEEINCPDKNAASIQLASDKNAYDYYEMCGECPITKSLETLLNAIVKSPVYEPTSDFQLSCYPQSKFPEYTQSLEDAMHFENTSTGPVSWNSSSIDTDERLNVSIQRSGATPCAVKLQLSTDGYVIDDYSTGTKDLHRDFDWSEIKSICCVSTFDSPTILPYEPGKHFLASALVTVTDADHKTRDEKISIEGKSCINLTDCAAPVICTPTDSAVTLENLLNQLMFRAPATNPTAGDAITQNLVTSSDIALDVNHGAFDDEFIGQIKAATAMTDAVGFKWAGTDLGVGHFNGLLKGIASNNTETGQCLVTLEVDGAFPGTASFDDILEINSLMPDKTTCVGGTTSSFVCYALVAYEESGVPKKKYVVLKGTMPCTVLGRCVTAHKPTISN